MDWDRNKIWVADDKTKFFVKLNCAGKNIRTQCLRMQVKELVKSQDQQNLKFAQDLLDQISEEAPVDYFSIKHSNDLIGQNHQLESKLDLSLRFFRETIDNKKIDFSLRVDLFLQYAELVIKLNQIDRYSYVIKLLKGALDESIAQIEKYKISLLLSRLYNIKNNSRLAKFYNKLAKENYCREIIDNQKNEYLDIPERIK